MPKLTPLSEALWVSADVTVAAAAIAAGAPARWHATLVGFTFLAATWALVWRRDDDQVRRAGLSIAGLVIPGPIDVRALAGEAITACAWALGVFAVVAVPFYFGWRAWWAHAMPRATFALSLRPAAAANELVGQVLVIALPEEAFYRGYLQTRLDEVWTPSRRVLGAPVGPGLLVGAAIFALGHLATIHLATRLAVFFPALVFGWLRSRTRGIGASVLFHALCNVYSLVLGRGFGLY